MDFLDPAKRRAHSIRLIFGYFLIATAIVLVTLILVFQSYGYDLDRKTGAIIQNGLMFVSARPEPANVYLNDKLYKSQGNVRLVLPSDIYRLELKRSGYRSWKHTVSLAGGSIERLVYPFLFPAKLDTKDQLAYQVAPSFSTQSPDRHWILVLPSGQTGKFDVFDTTDFKKAPSQLVLPPGLIDSSVAQKIELVEWSTDNRHVLIKATSATSSQFVMIDRAKPAESYNVATTFKVAPTSVALQDKKYDQLYLYDQAAQTLSSASVKDGQLKPVASQVLGFKAYGNDVVLYATSAGAAEGKARIIYHDKDGNYFLQEAPVGNKYFLDMAQYDGKWYVSVGSAADGRIYIYKDPQPIIKEPSSAILYPTTVLRVENPQWMEFSANTQFLAVQSGSKFAVFDAERQRNYNFTLPAPLDAGSPLASWMDGARLIVNSAGKMEVTDYDGTNQQTLTANQPGIVPFFDRDYKLLFNIAPSVATPDQFALTRTNLIATKANQPTQ